MVAWGPRALGGTPILGVVWSLSMRLAFPRFSKPPIGTPLDWSSELTHGLWYFAPCWEAGGSTIADVVQGMIATASGATITWKPTGWTVGADLFGTTVNATTPALPASLQFTWPMTIVFGFRFNATEPAGSPILFGISYETGEASPYTIIGALAQSSTRLIKTYVCNGTTSENFGSSGTLSASTDYVYGASMAAKAQTSYLNGVLNTSGTASWSNPTWQSTSSVTFGTQLSSTNAQITISWAGIWNRVLSANEHAAIARNPWQIFSPLYPAAVLANHAANGLWFHTVRPVSDRSGSRNRIWAE